MYCSKCNALNDENYKFCHNCGSELSLTEGTGQNVVQTSNMQGNSKIQSPTMHQATEMQMPVSVNYQQNTGNQAQGNKKERKAGKLILSILCSVLIFVFATTTLALLSLRGSFSRERIGNVIDGINVREALEDEEIQDSIFIELKNSEAVAIYEDGTLKDFIEEKVFECCDYILGGMRPDDIYADDIVELMEDNEEIIFDETGEKLNAKDYDKIEELGQELEDSVEINYAVKTVRFICSTLLIVVLVLLITLCVLLLLKVRNKSLDTLVWIGSTFLLTAIFSLFAVLTMSVALRNSIIMGTLVDMIVELYVAELSKVLLINSGILLLIGALLLVVYQLIKNLKKVNA